MSTDVSYARYLIYGGHWSALLQYYISLTAFSSFIQDYIREQTKGILPEYVWGNLGEAYTKNFGDTWVKPECEAWKRLVKVVDTLDIISDFNPVDPNKTPEFYGDLNFSNFLHHQIMLMHHDSGIPYLDIAREGMAVALWFSPNSNEVTMLRRYHGVFNRKGNIEGRCKAVNEFFRAKGLELVCVIESPSDEIPF